MFNKKFFSILLIFIQLNLIKSKKYNVSTSSELVRALRKVVPGDSIILADGVYQGKFNLITNGNKTAPIKLIGSSHGAIFTNPKNDAIFLSASWWILSNFSVINASRTIVMEYASDSILTNLNIENSDHSSVRCRKNSTRITIENSRISSTGLVEKNNGEAIYIGSSKNNWDTEGPDRTSFITVRNNYIGPDVSSESVDIKEGCNNILVENNYINGTGMQDKNYSLTWISVKGTECIIRNNTGINSVQDGFAARTISNIYTNSGCNNRFLNNVCSNIKGKCVNLSLVTCKNEDAGNLTLD